MIAMPDHYDRLENRTPAARESALFRDLRHVLNVAKARVPALRAQLKGIDIAALQTRSDLAGIRILRQADLAALQAETPPLGGLTATRVPLLKQVFVGVELLVALEGQAKDWWGCGRALFAAGLRKGSLALNCFPYDLLPHGHMIASGAHAIGCPVVPAGNARLEAKIEAVQRLKPGFFCGAASHLKELLDHGSDLNADVSSLKSALVTGPMSAGRRNEFSLRGMSVRQVSLLPELGVIAFESGATDGMMVNEGLIVEIIDPVTSKPVAPGSDGEIVVSRINADYPLLRFGTGLCSSMLQQPSTCGRTNMRIKVPRPAPFEITGSDGLRITATHLREIKKHHPSLGRMRLFMRRPRGHDVIHLKAEHRGNFEALESVSKTLRLVTQMLGTVEFVEPGTLADDEAPIVDERSLN